jgi:hypothetical protein
VIEYEYPRTLTVGGGGAGCYASAEEALLSTKSRAELTKSRAELTKSRAELTKSRAELTKSRAELTKSRAELTFTAVSTFTGHSKTKCLLTLKSHFCLLKSKGPLN